MPARPVLHKVSLSEKGVKVATVTGLIFALITVVTVASLVTAASMSVLAFNKIYLRVIADTGTAKEKEYAQMVLKLRKRPYAMICAFVFTGSAMAELIPLLISLVMQEISQSTLSGNLNAISIVIAVALVIIFVELFPLGYTVRRVLFVNKFLIRFAEVILILWYPITFPANYVLEKLYEFRARSQKSQNKEARFASTEERFFRNEELVRFVEFHLKSPDGEGGDVHQSVVEILKGVFRLQKMNVREIMVGWRDLRYLSAIFSMETKVTRQTGLSLHGSELDGALLLEVEDLSDPQRVPDIEMIPMNGKKVRGFIHWTSFISGIDEADCRAKFLTREFMPIIYDCFEDIFTLLSILHHGRCKMALVVTPPTSERALTSIPPCSDYISSTEKVYWSNQPGISAHIKPIGVITYQYLLRAIFEDLSQSNQKMPDPMDRFKPVRLNTQEKLALVDSMALEPHEGEGAGGEKDGEKETDDENFGASTGLFEKVIRFGTRRRTGTLVAAKSPVTSSRGSLFEVMDGEWVKKENESP